MSDVAEPRRLLPEHARKAFNIPVWKAHGRRWDETSPFPSMMMFYERCFGPNSSWVNNLASAVRGWTPHQKRRFSMWCAMRMTRREYTRGLAEQMLQAIALCREES